MEQTFLLKHYGYLSIPEQNNMTAEERRWYLERLDEENRKAQKEAKKSQSTSSVPATPGQPPV
jgi:hypothetical protein